MTTDFGFEDNMAGNNKGTNNGSSEPKLNSISFLSSTGEDNSISNIIKAGEDAAKAFSNGNGTWGSVFERGEHLAVPILTIYAKEGNKAYAFNLLFISYLDMNNRAIANGMQAGLRKELRRAPNISDLYNQTMAARMDSLIKANDSSVSAVEHVSFIAVHRTAEELSVENGEKIIYEPLNVAAQAIVSHLNPEAQSLSYESLKKIGGKFVSSVSVHRSQKGGSTANAQIPGGLPVSADFSTELVIRQSANNSKTDPHARTSDHSILRFYGMVDFIQTKWDHNPNVGIASLQNNNGYTPGLAPVIVVTHSHGMASRRSESEDESIGTTLLSAAIAGYFAVSGNWMNLINHEVTDIGQLSKLWDPTVGCVPQRDKAAATKIRTAPGPSNDPNEVPAPLYLSSMCAPNALVAVDIIPGSTSYWRDQHLTRLVNNAKISDESEETYASFSRDYILSAVNRICGGKLSNYNGPIILGSPRIIDGGLSTNKEGDQVDIRGECRYTHVAETGDEELATNFSLAVDPSTGTMSSESIGRQGAVVESIKPYERKYQIIRNYIHPDFIYAYLNAMAECGFQIETEGLAPQAETGSTFDMNLLSRKGTMNTWGTYNDNGSSSSINLGSILGM